MVSEKIRKKIVKKMIQKIEIFQPRKKEAGFPMGFFPNCGLKFGFDPNFNRKWPKFNPGLKAGSQTQIPEWDLDFPKI